ncbi:hypothetical protein FKW44_008893, partial [Caligus rogercresseyi]
RGITINEDLSFQAFLQDSFLPPHRFKHLVKKDAKISKFSQVSNLVSFLNSVPVNNEEFCIKHALDKLQERVNEAVLPEEKRIIFFVKYKNDKIRLDSKRTCNSRKRAKFFFSLLTSSFF